MQSGAPIELKRADYQLRFSPQNSPIKDIIVAINETPAGGLIAMNGSYINHVGLVEALKLAQERGVRVELCVDATHAENEALRIQLSQADLNAINCLHTKRCIIFDTDPKDDVEIVGKVRSVILFTGSENLSNNVSTHHEYTLVSQNHELIKRHYKDHLFNKKLCKPYQLNRGDRNFDLPKVLLENKKEVPLSPRFMRIYNSQKYDSGKLKAKRIEKPVPTDATEKIYLSSMGFDDERIKDALLKKAHTGTEIILIVDKAAVKCDRGLRFLNELHAAKVKIYVWERSAIQHTKLLLRERCNKLDGHYLEALAVLSTGNLVKNSSTQINYDQIVPESRALSQDIRAYFDELQKVCTPFEKIDQKAIAQKKAQKGQDVCTLYCGTCHGVIGASSEKSLVKKWLKHCIETHERIVVDTLAIENIDSKKFYCACCPTCLVPFYTQKSEASTTLAIAKHLIKEHAVEKTNAQNLRKNISVMKSALYIAQKEKENK